MRLSTLVLLPLLAAAPAAAQTGPLYNLEPPPPGAGPAGEPRSRGIWASAAREADRDGNRSMEGLLRAADRALARGNWTLANELTERAQTELLNSRHVTGAGAPPSQAEGRALLNMSEARTAISRRNRSQAAESLRTAQTQVAQLGSPGTAGTATGAQPMADQPAGGGGPMR